MVLLATASICITGCMQHNMSDMFNDDSHRGEMFSEILQNDQWSSELIDSLMMKHHELMMTKMNDMMKSDQSMQMGMMDNMMSMCSTDSTMCKMMMDKTMGMCDMDTAKCNMMMGSMHQHPKAMKTMKDMGMCDMKNMESKEGHPQQHQ